MSGFGPLNRSFIALVLLPPLLWFGGYEIVAAVSHAQVTMLRAAAASQNVDAKAHWNRAVKSVRIDKTDTSSEFWANGITPGALVETYGLDVAYDSHGNSTSAPGRGRYGQGQSMASSSKRSTRI